MPLVGMRRSTRVFGARTLRSGKRFSTEPREGIKNTRVSNKENESDKIVVNFADRITRSASKSCKDLRQQTQNCTVMDINPEPTEETVPDAATEVPDAATEVADSAKEVKSKEQMCGIVYQRKRKKAEFPSNTGLSEDKRFGKKFVRKRLKKDHIDSEALEICGGGKRSISRSRELSIIAFRSSSNSSYWITCFLTSVLSYMTKVGLRMRQLSAFVLCKPVFDAYHSHGVLFRLQGSFASSKNIGVCVISGSRSSIPLIHVDFSAIPCFFRHLHINLWFRSLDVSCLSLQQSLVANEKDEELVDFMDDITKEPYQIAFNENHSDILDMVSPSSPDGNRIISNFFVSPSNTRKKEVLRSASLLRTGSLTMQLRSSYNSNSNKIRKRRSALRHRRTRGQSSDVREALVADFVRIRRGGSQSPASAPTCEPKDLDKSCSIIQEIKSNIEEVFEQGPEKSSCTADVLITEADKCYRVEGAIIGLKQSDSDKWSIVIIKDGIELDLTPEKMMKLSSFNRFTHATQWASDVGWRLEFPQKQEWLTFKELYKECFERNSQSIPAPAASVIPVPGVHEVVSCASSSSLPYVRPDSYISMKSDELTRAVERKTANYDMDSGDEEWLRRFNHEMSLNNELQEHITPERFELIIDSLEKSIQFAESEFPHGQAADDVCALAGIKDVLEPIRRYWAKKRKHKHLGLLKIFQLYKPRRTPAIPNVVLRKKRSFKHPSNRKGRGKQRNILQAISFQRDALEQRKHNMHKVKEAKAVADRSEGLAIEKRYRAQMLTENADLATYKALTALRIAEAAAQSFASVDTVASFFLAN